MTDRILKTWSEIASVTPYAANTLKKRFGADMRAGGYVIRDNLGKSKIPIVWAWESQIKLFFSQWQKKKENP